jgi:broad specificity phosphatase PhoE
VASPEPKAFRTGEIVAEALGIPMTTVADLREIDRPVLPILPAPEHQRMNARLFAEPDRAVVGRESARAAQERFTEAVRSESGRTGDDLVAIAHGTVIALLVSRHNDVDGFQLWKRLECASLVVLEKSTLALVEGVDGMSQPRRAPTGLEGDTT